MSHQSELIASDIDAYLAEHERKDLLRFLTCGSVDDGKSTLIGRLLHDSKMIYEDQLALLEADSTTQGSAGEAVDLALLTDGLKAEREQGITIDVAYRYFSTAKRKFIIADTPGHEQYTRNMVTGASNCQLAIILVDARYGVQAQTKRHSYIASLLGIRHVAVAINKMDLVDWSEERFDEICEDYRSFTKTLDLINPYFLPMSALLGDNVVDKGENLGWFSGHTLMEHLETVDVEAGVDLERFRMPVQMVSRPNLDFRGFAGTIASGVLRPGDEIVSLPSGVSSKVARIFTFDGDLDIAGPGRAVTVTLEDEIDVSRGDLLVKADAKPLRAHEIDAMLVWMDETTMQPGRQYLLQSSNGASNASVTTIRHRVDINTLDHEAASELGLNDIALCALSSDKELLFDPYETNRQTGSFVLVDRLTNATVGAGMITGASSTWDRAPEAGLTRQISEISSSERAIRYGQKPATILLTGLTAAGKSTIATALERELFDRGKVTIRLDGENVRMGISRDLGFSAQERSENLRRVAEVARLANNQGVLAIAALVAPKAEVRHRARDLIGEDRFVEIFIDTPLEVCRDRDPEGLYAAADKGEIPMFPGVSATYERPTDADLTLDTSVQSPDECVSAILALLGAADSSVADGPVSENIVRAEGRVIGKDRAANFGHDSRTVWFTGLSGSGKSTLAFALEHALIDRGVAAYVLDGDNIRFGLNSDLGFSPEDRTENIRRIGEVCRLFQDSGMVVLTAFISPYIADRDQVRSLHPEGTFVEVFVDTPLEICEARDVKGLYKKARAGEIGDFSGISAPYEPPPNPEIRVDTSKSLDDCVAELISYLQL